MKKFIFFLATVLLSGQTNALINSANIIADTSFQNPHEQNILDRSWSSKMLNPDGAYVWVVWRHYKGCVNGDGKYIGRT